MNTLSMVPRIDTVSMITVTATSTSRIPEASLMVKSSPKTSAPMHTAVSGSKAPSTEVNVPPIFCTASTRVMLDTTVGRTARSTRFPTELTSGGIWRLPEARSFTPKITVVKINT